MCTTQHIEAAMQRGEKERDRRTIYNRQENKNEYNVYFITIYTKSLLIYLLRNHVLISVACLVAFFLSFSSQEQFFLYRITFASQTLFFIYLWIKTKKLRKILSLAFLGTFFGHFIFISFNVVVDVVVVVVMMLHFFSLFSSYIFEWKFHSSSEKSGTI